MGRSVALVCWLGCFLHGLFASFECVLQSTQQGGAFIFKGETCVWQYFDPATAAHVNAQQLLKRTLEIAGKA